MPTLPATTSPYRACLAQSFRAEFGVCRGEAISHLEDLNLGDIYLIKPNAKWLPVDSADDTHSAFTLDLAANLPVQDLVTHAHLIFMTTTGRRADVFAVMSQGQLYIVTDRPLKTGLEYVLIHIETCDVEFAPVVVPAPAQVPQPPSRVPAYLKRIG